VRFHKYHALGNDYIVIRPEALQLQLTPDVIRLICHRNFGVGSDGILLGPLSSKVCQFGVRIFNPDGTEAEKSGNGLRIFARALADMGLVGAQSFTVETISGPVSCMVRKGGRMVTVQIGEAIFHSQRIPVVGPPREVLNEDITVDGRKFKFCAVTVGNPHCVILAELSAEEVLRYGPLIENDPCFPNRTNVQFLKVIDEKNIKIEIWERGAGYTLSSGTSSTAAAAVAHKLGLCGPDIAVHMPGGTLQVQFEGGFIATLTGPVTKVCDGEMSDEMFDALPFLLTLGKR
jgi:diaminopimelate epimerase